MKTIPFQLTLILTFCLNLPAQKSQQGIYLSANDFRNGIISYPPIPGKKYKLILNETFYKPYVKIMTGDSVCKLYKDSIFGYRDKENSIYRFYDHNLYEVLNPREPILLYSRNTLGGYKNTQTIVHYFFSAQANSTVLPLTKWCLKNSFPGNPVFNELLDMYFNNDNDLMAYDSYYKMYKLNRVLQFSKQLSNLNEEK